MILGACGQIGTELTLKLRELHGTNAVIACDLKQGSEELMNSGPFEIVDALNQELLVEIIEKYNVTQMYHLVAMLSATAEKVPLVGWDLNMKTLLIGLELAREGKIKKLFWPSSMGAFGPTSPKEQTPQHCVMEPTTVYGISKLAGEHWCQYYFDKYGVDVRSIRYPGIISWKTQPGGGTTDYAVDIFHQAIKTSKYESFLSENTKLPMMYMTDAIRATIELMEAPAKQVKIRSSYNLAGVSFFEISYNSDFRQKIADSWPRSINDEHAKNHWGWALKYDLEKMTKDMIINLKKCNVPI